MNNDDQDDGIPAEEMISVADPLSMEDKETPVLDEQAEGALDRRHIQGVIEALLFVNERPVSLAQIKGVLPTVSSAVIKKEIQELRAAYEERRAGMVIVEIAGGYQMLSNSLYAAYIRDFYKTRQKERLSKPALESLAIIAYKQPVTRGDIERIRGVNSDGVVNHLLSKELIKAVGRKEVPGRPFLYGTTKQFLEYFGLKSLEDLPRLEEFPDLVPPAESEDVQEEEGESPRQNHPQQEGDQEREGPQELARED